MFDTHCHILPMVDDGATSLQESLNMIKMAYEDGVRAILATPHKNHPIDFRPQKTAEEAFELLRSSVAEIYPDFELYLGAEFYITDDYLDVLEKNERELVSASSGYILIEFDRGVRYQHMSDVVHELKVRGFRPIIAHAEMYGALTDSPENVYRLKDQGALIQLTAASIEGKRGSRITSFCESLIRNSAADFAVSDAHGEQRRKPLLSSAYRKVTESAGKEAADRLFIINPRLMVSGGEIHPTHMSLETDLAKVSIANGLKSKSSSGRKIMLMLASVLAAGFLIIGWASQQSGSEKMSAHASSSEIVAEKEASETEMIESEVSADQSGKINESSKTQADGKEDSSDSTKSSASKSEIEGRYYSKLKSLEGSYTGELEGIVANMMYAKKNITDEALLSSTLEAYKEEIFALEAQSDNKVYAALYDMQNELEKQDLDVSVVQQYRDEYNDVKLQKQQEYLERLGY